MTDYIFDSKGLQENQQYWFMKGFIAAAHKYAEPRTEEYLTKKALEEWEKIDRRRYQYFHNRGETTKGMESLEAEKHHHD